MLQNARRQGVVFCQFFQHFFIGTARTRRGFLNDGQTQLVKKDFTKLFGAAQVEGLPCNFIGFSFKLQNALPQGLALCGQRGAIYQHAIAFNAKQSFTGGNFDVINGAQFGIGLNAWPQHTVHIQALV